MRPAGSWVIEDARRLEAGLTELAPASADASTGTLVIDVSAVRTLDTAGAYLLVKLEQAWKSAGRQVEWLGADQARTVLIDRVRDVIAEPPAPAPPSRPSIVAEIGETMIGVGADARNLVAMLGAVVREFGVAIIRPSTFRGHSVIQQMDVAGLRAVPIIALMSFLIGGILAQQSAFQLRVFGAEVFAVDLVGIIALREIAVLLTSIMVAGRSGSAITAELGSMKMAEEIDALRVMGLDPVNVLVLPRVLALVIVVPLLTFIAALATLAGALLTLWFYSGIIPEVFLVRLRDAVDFTSLFSGLIKAPFMALIIACISCAEGMAVGGSAESLGRHTTAAVVKAIFMVIVVDGVFAIFYASINF